MRTLNFVKSTVIFVVFLMATGCSVTPPNTSPMANEAIVMMPTGSTISDAEETEAYCDESVNRAVDNQRLEDTIEARGKSFEDCLTRTKNTRNYNQGPSRAVYVNSYGNPRSDTWNDVAKDVVRSGAAGFIARELIEASNGAFYGYGRRGYRGYRGYRRYGFRECRGSSYCRTYH